MVISARKFSIAISMIVLLVIQLIFALPNTSPANVKDPDSTLLMISILCVISLVIEIILWVRLSGEFFSPYMVFFLVLFIFTCGQSIGWATGLDMGGRNMWSRVDHGTTRYLLTTGLCYSMMAVGCFHMGAIFCYSDINRRRTERIWNPECVVRVYKNLGKLMLMIVIPAFIAKTVQDVLAVASGGYSAYFAVNRSKSTMMSVFSILSDYYQPCMLILLIGNRDEPKKRRFIVFCMLIDVMFQLYIGGRSGAVMTGLGLLLAYHYFVRKFSGKQAILVAAGGYVGVAFLNGIASTRGAAGRGITDLLSVFGSSFTNVIGEFVGELGWTITSVCWTMNLVPSSYPFRYGMSYLVSLISWIPSSVFGRRSNHPVVIWGNLSDWLANTLHMGYGPGYTTVAESYINFGWYGLIAMMVEGMILCRLLSSVNRENVENDIFGATIQTLVIMIIMKSIVRSSLSAAMRGAVFVLIPFYLLLYLNLRKGADAKK